MTAVLLVLAWLFLILLILGVFAGGSPPPNGCTQNCNQGRRCTCGVESQRNA